MPKMPKYLTSHHRETVVLVLSTLMVVLVLSIMVVVLSWVVHLVIQMVVVVCTHLLHQLRVLMEI